MIDYTTPSARQNPLSAFKARRRLADRQVNIDYSLHNVLIDWRPDWAEKLKELVKLGAPSVKLFMIYKERGWQADDGRMLAVMKSCKKLGVKVCVHAENDEGGALGCHERLRSGHPPRWKANTGWTM